MRKLRILSKSEIFALIKTNGSFHVKANGKGRCPLRRILDEMCENDEWSVRFDRKENGRYCYEESAETLKSDDYDWSDCVSGH